MSSCKQSANAYAYMFDFVLKHLQYHFQTGEITDEKAKEFRSKVYEVTIIFEVVQYFLITLGVLCLLAAFVLLFVLTSSGEVTCSSIIIFTQASVGSQSKNEGGFSLSSFWSLNGGSLFQAKTQENRVLVLYSALRSS